MQVNGAATLSADIVGRTITAVEILTGYEQKDTKYCDSSYDAYCEDLYDSAPYVENYNNYTKTGNTVYNESTQQENQIEPAEAFETVPVNNAKDGTTPDISSSHGWEDPISKYAKDTLYSVFGRRAAESKRYPDPIMHAAERYKNPNSPHYVGHDMTDHEKQIAYMNECCMIWNGRLYNNGWDNPIFEGRGLGRSDPAIQRGLPLDGRLSSAGLRLHNRNMVTSQLNGLFARNGISIPENTRLSFTINAQFRLRVTGTDDENLIKQIEILLNSNDNSSQLYWHILKSTRTFEDERITDQVKADSLRKFYVDWAIMQYTDYTRQDLELADGKFLTKDGIDIMELIKKGITEQFSDSVGIIVGYTRQELEWLAKIGPDNIPDMVLTIDYENGSLFDVGQHYGYGPGQTGWIGDLLGGKDPHDGNSWLPQ